LPPVSDDALTLASAGTLLQTLIALSSAFVLGTAIGFERQWRQRTAGLRTNVLVAVGAAAFSDLGLRLFGHEGAVRIIAYVVSGIGFLGAGVILKEGASIRGLNTAATLGCSAAVGTFSGAGLPIEAAVVTVFVLAGNTLLRPMVNWVNRRPLTESATEAQYCVLVSCHRDNVSDVRDLIDETLTRFSYPSRRIEASPASGDEIDLEADLVPTTADPAELDQVVADLERSPLVLSATWTFGMTG
jgi:putative Mg2+ transporter-C (MgtC) family protein